MTDLSQLLACPRCDKSPLELSNETYRCHACKIDFPSIDGIPWMFAEPQAALGEWRGRLQFAVQKLSHELEGLDPAVDSPELYPADIIKGFLVVTSQTLGRRLRIMDDGAVVLDGVQPAAQPRL